eukprot:2102631-Alexandrium_andersonii.AAC.1
MASEKELFFLRAARPVAKLGSGVIAQLDDAAARASPNGRAVLSRAGNPPRVGDPGLQWGG